jgi:5'-phosphate synthase pdxT subunit
MKIGVLALQGDFDAHRRRLEELGAEVVLVKKPEQLEEIDGLVIPGGESGTFLKLLGESGFEKLKEFVHTKPTFGTCAGAILLATEVDNPKQAGLGALDIGNDPVAVRQGKTMAATFHPELSEDSRVHRSFLDLINNGHQK